MVEELAGGLLRFIGQIFLEIFFELAIKGPGYIIASNLNWSNDPDSGRTVAAGFAFWFVFGAFGYGIYKIAV